MLPDQPEGFWIREAVSLQPRNASLPLGCAADLALDPSAQHTHRAAGTTPVCYCLPPKVHTNHLSLIRQPKDIISSATVPCHGFASKPVSKNQSPECYQLRTCGERGGGVTPSHFCLSFPHLAALALVSIRARAGAIFNASFPIKDNETPLSVLNRSCKWVPTRHFGH